MADTTVSQQIADLSERYWTLLLDHNPTWASALGYRQHDHRLPDISPDGRQAYLRHIDALARELETLPRGPMTHTDEVTVEVLDATLSADLASAPHPDYRWSVNPLFGTHVWLAELSQRQPASTSAEVDRLLERYRRIPALLQQEMTNLREGIQHGQTAFRVAVERSIAQIERLLSIPATQSSFMPPAMRGESPAELQHLTDRVAHVVESEIYPTYAAYRSFLKDEYLFNTRTTPGVGSLPGGEAYYRFCIRHFTGIERDPAEVHRIGLEELGRIQQEMHEVAERLGGFKDMRSFADHLKTLPDQRPVSREAIREFNQAVLDRAEAALPAWFDRLPQRPCQVKLVEAYREADSPAGYYDRAPDDGSRPAYYYVNGHDPSDRPYFNMEALAFHEAMPGHHLQIAIAQELGDLPMFRRHLGDTAFIEGWALYSERLADEMGLYSSDTARFGKLSFQAWRACRLVIDTGLHALDWDRQRAIDFLVANTAHSLTEATIEVDRYICMPGQALAYMLGRMEIDRLRAQAKQRLGARFDIKDFHRHVLENGAVPLASLTRLIDRWLEHS